MNDKQDPLATLRKLSEEMRECDRTAGPCYAKDWADTLHEALRLLDDDGCLWEPEDDPDVSWWNTSCGQAWSFTTDGPKENGMNFCHYCGKPLRLNPERTNG